MALSGSQMKLISDALLSAYSRYSDLARMMKFELDENLSHIVKESDMRTAVFELIQWAESNGRIEELIRGAHSDLPSNPVLGNLVGQIGDWGLPTESEPLSKQSSTEPIPTEDLPSPLPQEPIDIFLGYSRQDLDTMRRLHDDLRSNGFTVWTDEIGLEPGTRHWQSEIEEALNRSRCMVVLLSPQARASEWIGREIHYAQLVGLYIIPVLIEGTESTAVPFSLLGTQWVDMRSVYDEPLHRKLIPTLRTWLDTPDPVQDDDDLPSITKGDSEDVESGRGYQDATDIGKPPAKWGDYANVRNLSFALVIGGILLVALIWSGFIDQIAAYLPPSLTEEVGAQEIAAATTQAAGATTAPPTTTLAATPTPTKETESQAAQIPTEAATSVSPTSTVQPTETSTATSTFTQSPAPTDTLTSEPTMTHTPTPAQTHIPADTATPVDFLEISQGPFSPDILVLNQSIIGNTVRVSRVVINDPGWLVIYADQNGILGSILGQEYLQAGINPQVEIKIDTDQVTDTLHAALHTDSGVQRIFEYPQGPDIPYGANGNIFSSPFLVTDVDTATQTNTP